MTTCHLSSTSFVSCLIVCDWEAKRLESYWPITWCRRCCCQLMVSVGWLFQMLQLWRQISRRLGSTTVHSSEWLTADWTLCDYYWRLDSMIPLSLCHIARTMTATCSNQSQNQYESRSSAVVPADKTYLPQWTDAHKAHVRGINSPVKLYVECSWSKCECTGLLGVWPPAPFLM